MRCKHGLRLVSPSLPITSSFSSSPSLSTTMVSTPSTSFPPSLSSSSSSTSSYPASNTTTTTSTTSTSFTTTPRGGTSSPIAIRNSPSHHPISHARSLPSALPSFMRTAAVRPLILTKIQKSKEKEEETRRRKKSSLIICVQKWTPFANACEVTFTLAQQASHEADCPHRPVVCYNDGCNEKVIGLGVRAKSCINLYMYIYVGEKQGPGIAYGIVHASCCTVFGLQRNVSSD